MRIVSLARPRILAARSKKEQAPSSATPKPSFKASWTRRPGTAQDLYGQAADTARESAAGFDKWLRTTIETQPYTAAAVALGIGWLLGRFHRPL